MEILLAIFVLLTQTAAANRATEVYGRLSPQAAFGVQEKGP
jgi:hypothetical protein